ncbi:MAG: helix-turn-helix domain-containing protein [Ruminiclostridium sp.]|nr:helix-turn-helix domain-containing protein [Ruminiclostridium sp.]
MEFGSELQRLRKQNGLSQEELGEKLGVSRQTISKWENDTAYPDMLNLITISDYFGVKIDDMIAGKKEEPELPDTTEVRQEEEAAVPEEAHGNAHSQFHCEYKSRITVRGLPLIHVNYGFGDYRARGVVAIGNISTGVLSIGILAKGIISIGILSLGLFAIGVLSLAFCAVGCVAAGIISIAGIALGVMTLGGLALGVVSVGGCAVASHISVGGVAIAPISVGFIVNGDDTIVLQSLQEVSTVTAEKITGLIDGRFPDLPFFLRDWASMLFM